jgi:hypothetical protein
MKISGQGLDCELHFSEPDAEGWMPTAVRIKTPAFEGAFACSVEVGERKGFVQELRALEASIGQDAVASWRNMEDNIEFGPTLSGTFQADQTFLLGWIREAEQALEVNSASDD